MKESKVSIALIDGMQLYFMNLKQEVVCYKFYKGGLVQQKINPMDVSFLPCSECEQGVHHNCPCPCLCPCELFPTQKTKTQDGKP